MTDPLVDQPLERRLLLGRYRVVRRLAEGGMGAVYLARTEGADGFRKPVVVKRMKLDARAHADGTRLFRREADILSRMQHPNVLNALDFGVEDGSYLMVLEYVHGYSLQQWIEYRTQVKRPIPVDVCLYVVREVLEALHYAHNFDGEDGGRVEIIHRDIAADNVLLSTRGHIRLLDFGVASIRGANFAPSTQSGDFRGKLGYGAPETLMGEPATTSADQYSAGVLLYEMLTLELPFVAATVQAAIVQMMTKVPDPVSAHRPDVPPELDAVLMRALEKDPAARYESALDLARELRRCQRTEDEEAFRTLADMLRSDFDALPDVIGVEPLKVREQALTQVLEPLEGEADRTGSRPELAVTQLSLATGADGSVADRTASLVAMAQAPARGPSWTMWVLLFGLVFGGLALAAGAFYGLASRNGGQQVIVYGEGQGPDGPATGAAEPATARTAGTVPERSASDAPSASAAPGASTAAAPTTTKGRLEAALQTQSAPIEACFAAHLSDAAAKETLQLHFTVRRAGGAAIVRVEPAEHAAGELGQCLKTAGERVEFPALESDMAFRVPVRAKVAGPGAP